MQIELVTNNQVYQVIILKRIIEKQVTRAFAMFLRCDMHLNGPFNIFKPQYGSSRQTFKPNALCVLQAGEGIPLISGGRNLNS